MTVAISTDMLELQSTRAKPRWTCNEYEALGDRPPLQGRRSELISGEIFLMPAMNDPHAVAVTLCDRAIRRVFIDEKYLVRMQMPVRLGDHDEPEPDHSVVLGPPRRYLGHGHPREAFLLIEVADTSLKVDLGVKASLYAAMNVQDYWVVDLNGNRVLVHRQPEPDQRRTHKFFYNDIRVYNPGEHISPLEVLSATVAVDDLLP